MSPTLSMPLFVRPEDVILRLQLGADLAGIEDVIASGIMGSQLHVQRILDSKLVRQSHDCMYHLDADAFSGIQPGGVFRLEAPSGFIRQDTPIVVSASDDLPTGSAFGAFGLVDMSVVKIEHDRGYILIDSGTNTNCYVRVQCDTGYEGGTTPLPVLGIDDYSESITYVVGSQVVFNGVVYTCVVAAPAGTTPDNASKWKRAYIPIEQIPEDVYEAIMAMVPVIFDSSQVTNRNQEAESQYKKAADHSAMLLQPYIRTKGFTFRPLWR